MHVYIFEQPGECWGIARVYLSYYTERVCSLTRRSLHVVPEQSYFIFSVSLLNTHLNGGICSVKFIRNYFRIERPRFSSHVEMYRKSYCSTPASALVLASA